MTSLKQDDILNTSSTEPIIRQTNYKCMVSVHFALRVIVLKLIEILSSKKTFL
jgi:hypothetical protein